MSTRAVYSFVDGGTFHVYKHCDGYPSGAADALQRTVDSGLAWPLPRFEPCEFGAAFIAANKTTGGNLRLCTGPKSHGDLEYYYRVTAPAGALHVECYAVDYTGPDGIRQRLRKLYAGPLSLFASWAAVHEAA